MVSRWVRKTWVGLVLLAAGCVEALPVVRLTPAGDQVTWVSGRAVVEHLEGGIRVAAAFDHATGQNAVFRVEVQNDTPDRIDIDPKDMRFVTCDTESICSAPRSVIDPEQTLVELDRQRSSGEASATNSETAATALILLGATASIASTARGDTGSADRTLLAGAALSNTARDERGALTRVESDRKEWSDAALRRTTLFTGRGSGGLVFAPLVTDAKFVWLNVAAAGHSFWFRFTQRVVEPEPSTAASADGDGTRQH